MFEINVVYSALSGKMRWVGHCLLLLLPTALSYVDSGRQLPPIFWNSSNAMFHSSNNDHMIDVNLGDRLNIHCPHYTDNSVSNNQWEYYLIYMVDRYNYEVCVINDTSNKIPILNCSNPEHPKVFKMLIFDFQPIPGIPDFQIGKRYYFISTSGGRKFNVNNQYEGACKEHQMKIMLRVRPKTVDVIGNGPRANKNEDNYQSTSHSKVSERLIPTTDTTTTATDPTTVSQKSIFRRPSDKSSEDYAVPGLDGFPDDETVIHTGEGPSINSGIIADSGLENSGIFLHYQHRHSYQLLCVIVFYYMMLSIVLMVVR